MKIDLIMTPIFRTLYDRKFRKLTIAFKRLAQSAEHFERSIQLMSRSMERFAKVFSESRRPSRGMRKHIRRSKAKRKSK